MLPALYHEDLACSVHYRHVWILRDEDIQWRLLDGALTLDDHFL
jgi:hypothetical protein